MAHKFTAFFAVQYCSWVTFSLPPTLPVCSVAVESSPLGSLHHYLREEGLGLVEIGTSTIHHILLQVTLSPSPSVFGGEASLTTC